MSKKSFNDIEAYIKQLADAHEAAFEEDAWVKMEKLLDKEDRRKRPIFFLWWLLPLILAGGLTVYFGMQNSRSSRLITVSDVKEVQSKPNDVTQVQKNVSGPPTITILSAGDRTGASGDAAQGSTLFDNRRQRTASYKKSTGNLMMFSKGRTSEIKNNPSRTRANQNDSLSVATQDTYKPGKNDNESLSETTAPSDNHGISGTTMDKKQQKEASLEKHELEKPGAATVKISKRRFAMQGFYFLIGAGVEMNGLKLLPTKNATARLGFGVGYKLKRRLSLETGFYSSTKKYVAGAGDYTPKAGSYWSTVDIKSVEANCRVYEIPVAVRYDFKSKNRIGYFSSIGLSSFLMKKEDYHYSYEHYGIAYNSSAAYKGNRHLFSVVRFAVGAEKKLNSNWSIQASPGFSVPLAGVGEGQVKLFSTDVMLGLKFSPGFKKNK